VINGVDVVWYRWGDWDGSRLRLFCEEYATWRSFRHLTLNGIRSYLVAGIEDSLWARFENEHLCSTDFLDTHPSHSKVVFHLAFRLGASCYFCPKILRGWDAITTQGNDDATRDYWHTPELHFRALMPIARIQCLNYWRRDIKNGRRFIVPNNLLEANEFSRRSSCPDGMVSVSLCIVCRNCRRRHPRLVGYSGRADYRHPRELLNIRTAMRKMVRANNPKYRKNRRAAL
jgi:hypothetical protein